MEKSVVIIGAGIGGLSAGCYSRMNGYRCLIVEMHNLPGGVCTSWKRRGYTFDGCIHHLAGCVPGSHVHRMWQELGALPARPVIYPEELVRVEAPDGGALTVFADIDRLERHMKWLAPTDSLVIEEYISAARLFTSFDLLDMVLASRRERYKLLKHAPSLLRWMSVKLKRYAERFNDPALRRTFPHVQYGDPGMPMLLHLQMLAGCHKRYYGWPAGGSLEFSRAIERRYLELGGEIGYGAKADRVLLRGDRAVGVRLRDGSELYADVVISNANGKATIFDMLGGRYASRRIRSFYSRPDDRVSMGIHVCLGAARDLSREPHALALLLAKPVEIAGEMRERLDVENFAFDRSMAPEGKASLKVVLPTSYRYWMELRRDQKKYEVEKERAAEAVIEQLEPRFPGLREQIEVVDVATPVTTERYTGVSSPFRYLPHQMFLAAYTEKGMSMTLPGLERFYMAGQYAGFPSLVNVAAMGRNVVKRMCEEDCRPFVTSVPEKGDPPGFLPGGRG